MPVNYKNGIIYRIYDNTNGDVYYGSTANTLRYRMGGHKTDAKIGKKCKSKSIILNDDYFYNEIEKYPCNSKKELDTRERYYIENFTCVNKYVPTRTNKEWREDNKEEYKEYQSKYYEDHKEQIKAYSKQYQEDHKEEKQEYNKKYNQDNKEEIKDYNKKYNQDHKEERFMKHNCLCGGKYTLPSKAKHERQHLLPKTPIICIECK